MSRLYSADAGQCGKNSTPRGCYLSGGHQESPWVWHHLRDSRSLYNPVLLSWKGKRMSTEYWRGCSWRLISRSQPEPLSLAELLEISFFKACNCLKASSDLAYKSWTASLYKVPQHALLGFLHQAWSATNVFLPTCVAKPGHFFWTKCTATRCWSFVLCAATAGGSCNRNEEGKIIWPRTQLIWTLSRSRRLLVKLMQMYLRAWKLIASWFWWPAECKAWWDKVCWASAYSMPVQDGRSCINVLWMPSRKKHADIVLILTLTFLLQMTWEIRDEYEFFDLTKAIRLRARTFEGFVRVSCASSLVVNTMYAGSRMLSH